MGTDEGALFLLRRAKYITEDALIEAASPADQGEAKAIAAQLEGLPLALDQAGAYIEKTGCGLSGYLSRYRIHGPELLRRRGSLKSDHSEEALKSEHPDPVAATWAISFEKIGQANPAAAELLRFCAFLQPDQIPEEVFSKGVPELGPVLERVGADALILDDAIAELLKYSLIRRDPNARILEIHRLVQAVLKLGMDEVTERLWAERAVRAVSHVFPEVELSTWTVCERLLPQAYACAELIKQYGFEFSEAARLLNQAGFYSYERGRYTDAEAIYQRALAIREKTLGPHHADVAAVLNNLAELYGAQSQSTKAEPLHERALAIREKALGPEHPDVAKSLNNLAWLYYTQGRYAEAECLNQRALAIREKALGPEHPVVATTLNNLAVLYATQGQYAKAEPLYQRALAIREKALGPEHPRVAKSLENYASLLRAMGRPEDAGQLEARARAIQAKSA